MTIKKDEKKAILFDESIIGMHPFAMKELILRGYRILAVSPSPTLLNMQVKAVQKKELIIERRLKI